MLRRLKKLIESTATKAKAATVDIRFNDPIRIAILENRLKQTETRAYTFQGMMHIYLRELVVSNRALIRKVNTIKNLRTKIVRMEECGAFDPILNNKRTLAAIALGKDKEDQNDKDLDFKKVPGNGEIGKVPLSSLKRPSD